MLHQQRPGVIALGYFAAAIAAGASLGLILGVGSALMVSARTGDTILLTVVLVILSILIGVPYGALVGGLAIFAVALLPASVLIVASERFQISNKWAYVCAGAALGGALQIAYVLLPVPGLKAAQHVDGFAWLAVLVFTTAGAVGGAVYWLVAFRRQNVR